MAISVRLARCNTLKRQAICRSLDEHRGELESEQRLRARQHDSHLCQRLLDLVFELRALFVLCSFFFDSISFSIIFGSRSRRRMAQAVPEKEREEAKRSARQYSGGAPITFSVAT